MEQIRNFSVGVQGHRTPVPTGELRISRVPRRREAGERVVRKVSGEDALAATVAELLQIVNFVEDPRRAHSVTTALATHPEADLDSIGILTGLEDDEVNERLNILANLGVISLREGLLHDVDSEELAE